MITKISISDSLNISDEMIGYVVEESKPIISGDKLKLYVPGIMSNVTKSKAATTIQSTYGTTLFKNNLSCMPKVSPTVTTANYITAVMENNSSSEHIQSNGVIPYNTKVNVEFYKGKLLKPQFNTDLV